MNKIEIPAGLVKTFLAGIFYWLEVTIYLRNNIKFNLDLTLP
jgi:hypothetical protein